MWHRLEKSLIAQPPRVFEEEEGLNTKILWLECAIWIPAVMISCQNLFLYRFHIYITAFRNSWKEQNLYGNKAVAFGWPWFLSYWRETFLIEKTAAMTMRQRYRAGGWSDTLQRRLHYFIFYLIYLYFFMLFVFSFNFHFFFSLTGFFCFYFCLYFSVFLFYCFFCLFHF